MLRSMTGYGRGEAAGLGKKLTIELKAVNHRFSEVVVRLPKSMNQLEDRIRQFVQSKISRGRIDCYLTAEESAGKIMKVKVDKNLATSYYKAIKEVFSELGISGEVGPEHILSLPGLLTLEEPAEDIENFWPIVHQVLEEAVGSLLEMRDKEGKRLQEDIRCRTEKIKQLNTEIEKRAPLVTNEYRARLSQRIQELLPESRIDPGRMVTEVAFFAERSNITEENVRIQSHLSQLISSLDAEEPVGRKLDFLIQEINREINTIASKANDLMISQTAVEVKSELEKIREQVQNVE